MPQASQHSESFVYLCSDICLPADDAAVSELGFERVEYASSCSIVIDVCLSQQAMQFVRSGRDCQPCLVPRLSYAGTGLRLAQDFAQA